MSDNFLNVKVAMTKARLNVRKLADEMGISPQALYQKFKGKTEFTLSDMNTIKNILSNHIGENLTLEYLFGDGNDN